MAPSFALPGGGSRTHPGPPTQRAPLAIAALTGVIVGLIGGVLFTSHAAPAGPQQLRDAALTHAVAASGAACAACPACEEVEPAAACPEASSTAACSTQLVAPATFYKGGVAPGAGALPPPPPWRLSAAAPEPPGGAAGPNGMFQRLIAWGFAPTLILDVGANEGNWAREAWSAFGAGSPQPKLLMFEGSERRAASLSGVGFPYVISVVGPQADRIEFYDSPGGGTGNSVLKENTKHYADVAPQQTVARTLDELLEAAMGQGIVQRPVPLRGTLLKLDVQGFELAVLAGARGILSTVEVLVLEASVLPWNAGAPLVGEVLGTLHALGFTTLELLERHGAGPTDQVFQHDFAFARSDSPLITRACEAAEILGACGARTQ